MSVQRRKRLFVLLPRRGPSAVILRRRPGSWTQLVSWNTDTDAFEHGQWFHGKLYQRRCDLSPSGAKLIYFVAKHHLAKVDPSYSSAWTAVSKPPYFTALALWSNRGTTYHGGGLFLDEDDILLNAIDHGLSDTDSGQSAPPHPKHVPPSGVHIAPMSSISGDAIFPARLLRDGWTEIDPRRKKIDWEGTLRREIGDLRLELVLGPGRMGYSLFARRRGEWEVQPFADVDWADFDQRGRLVFARGETLSSLDRVIATFSEGEPARVLTPAHAKKW